jgi:NADH dehydrogenase
MERTETKASGLKHIVVLGAGFGGLEFAKRFSSEKARVTIIDRQNHHLFQPLLYQVATAGLSAPEIAQPTRQILARRKYLTVLLNEVTGIDLKGKNIKLHHRKEPLAYDYLIIGLGVKTNYFGNDHWEKHAPGLKSLDDATGIRRHLLLAFEEAESTDDTARLNKLTTIAVIGGGPTGVELAGAISELARHVLKKDFRHYDPARARVLLIEAGPRVLPQFPKSLSESAKRQLEDLGVEVRTGESVKNIEEGKIALENEIIEAGNIIWAAGMKAGLLTAQLGVELDKSGRIMVQPDLSLPGHPEVFAVGDIASLVDAHGNPVPGICPAAIQMARQAAVTIEREIESPADIKPERKAFVYRDKGTMATIGRSKAVAMTGPFRLSGFLAWLSWLFIHLIFLIGFRNKMAVLLQWSYSYLTYKRGARIITGLDKRWRANGPEVSS